MSSEHYCFEMIWKTGENGGEKEDKTDQPDTIGYNVVSEQVDQTRKRNNLRERHTGILLFELAIIVNRLYGLLGDLQWISTAVDHRSETRRFLSQVLENCQPRCILAPKYSMKKYFATFS
jgi:hypothetical protein